MRKYTFETVGGQRFEGSLVIIAKRQDTATRRAERFLMTKKDNLTGLCTSEILEAPAAVISYDPGEYS